MDECLKGQPDVEQELMEKDPAAKGPGGKPEKKMKNTMKFIRKSIKFYFALIAVIIILSLIFSFMFLSIQEEEMRLEQFGMILTVFVLTIVFALLCTFKESWPINLFIMYANIWICGIVFGIGIVSYMRIIIWKVTET